MSSSFILIFSILIILNCFFNIVDSAVAPVGCGADFKGICKSKGTQDVAECGNFEYKDSNATECLIKNAGEICCVKKTPVESCEDVSDCSNCITSFLDNASSGRASQNCWYCATTNKCLHAQQQEAMCTQIINSTLGVEECQKFTTTSPPPTTTTPSTTLDPSLTEPLERPVPAPVTSTTPLISQSNSMRTGSTNRVLSKQTTSSNNAQQTTATSTKSTTTPAVPIASTPSFLDETWTLIVAVGAGTVVLCIIVIIGLCCYVKRGLNDDDDDDQLAYNVSPIGLTPSPQISHASNRVPSQQFSNRLDGGVQTPPGPSRVPVPIAAGVGGGEGQYQLSPVLQENDYFAAAPPTNEYDYVQNFQPESALSNPQSSQFSESVQF